VSASCDFVGDNIWPGLTLWSYGLTSAQVDQQKTIALRNSYDTVAAEYAQRIYDELKDKPFDRQWLDDFASELAGVGPVCDVGCGPGHVTRYLAERGVNSFGLDLSPGMVKCARRLNPGLIFQPGNLLTLPLADGCLAGVVAFYSIIHIPREEVVSALRECRRVLRPGGKLLLAFHLGETVLHLDEWWGRPVAADFVFFQTEEMRGYLLAAGFSIEKAIERPPYAGVEHQSRRAYILARKP
jgi:SAM-dependent methyltransferase